MFAVLGDTAIQSTSKPCAPRARFVSLKVILGDTKGDTTEKNGKGDESSE
jgi:hypothetical protein